MIARFTSHYISELWKRLLYLSAMIPEKDTGFPSSCPRNDSDGKVGNDSSGLQVTLPKIVRILYMSVIDGDDDLLDEGDSG